jgi:hypothetical protein
MVKVVEQLGVGLVIALASIPLAACGGSSGDAAGSDSGSDVGTPAQGDRGDRDGGRTGDAAQASGGDAGLDATQDSAEAGSVATEPSYLRNDAIAGFAYTANFGSPYDSILAAPLNTTQSAIDTSYTTAPAASQFEANNMFALVANSADLYSALNISTSLSVSAGLASVSAKTDFARSTQIDSTDLWAVVDLSEQGPTTKIVNPALTPQAAALSAEQFFALYGDRYAAEIVTGAEMFCTLQIHTTSQQDKSSLAISLNVGYGASSASGTFTSDSVTKIGTHSTTVRCGYVGFKPGDGGVPTTLAALLGAASDFQGGNASTLGDVSTSALYILYTSYYGIPGYPGVPAGTAARVTQQTQLASDYLLYNSLVQNDFAAYYADSNYSNQSFFKDMKAYRDGLSAFITASISNSLNPGVAAPTPAADGLITNWSTTSALTSPAGSDPQYTVYQISNGIVPKTISDYAIPLRYAYPDSSGHGTLNGTTFAPISPVAVVGQKQQALDVPLYMTSNKSGIGTGPWLEYQWDTGTYFLPGTTDSTGAQTVPVAPQVNAALAFGLSGDVKRQYVVVSKANGFVMTDNGGSAQMTATHLSVDSATTSVVPGQTWEFYLDSGNVIDNCATYVAPKSTSTAANGCSQSSNAVANQATNPPCGSLLYGISALHTGYWENTGSGFVANGGGGCDYCDWNCGSFHCPYSGCGGGPVPNDTFFLEPFDNGTTQAIYNFQGSNGGATAYMEADLSQTATNPNSNKVLSETPPIGGYGNELWVFIPAANVDTAPNP